FQLPISWSLVVACWAHNGAAAATSAKVAVASSILFMATSVACGDPLYPVEIFRRQRPAARAPVFVHAAAAPPRSEMNSLLPHSITSSARASSSVRGRYTRQFDDMN